MATLHNEVKLFYNTKNIVIFQEADGNSETKLL